MKKKILALLLAAAVVMSLAACGGDANQGGNTPANADQNEPAGPAAPNEPAGPAAPNEPAGEVYSVGISQYVTHDALDAATNGFIDAMNEKFGEDGWNTISRTPPMIPPPALPLPTPLCPRMWT